MKFCCEKFAKMYSDLPTPLRPNARFNRNDDGSWNINGCCVGGCYVVTEMKYCPYCGASLVLAGDERSVELSKEWVKNAESPVSKGT
jgi:hypothetical protein